MKATYFVLALAIAKGALSTSSGGCNADNCARAVTGTRPGKDPPVTSRQADCSSFMRVTVTPATSTTTTTKTITTTTTLGVVAKRGEPGLAPRQVTVEPSVVPAYASPCSGVVRYSSACSCWGITATTTTAPTPVRTITTTVTTVATVCPTGATKCGATCHNLQTSNGNCGACGHVCPTGTTCQSGTCKLPPGQCTNPTVCSGNDDCGTGGQGTCFCHPDPSGVGYCHPVAECNFPLCNENKDCATGSVCVDNCCGKVCRPIQTTCVNLKHKSRLFKERGEGQWSDPVVGKRDAAQFSDPVVPNN